MRAKPLYISTSGASIVCLSTTTGRIFRSCSQGSCFYSSNLHTAKEYLHKLEVCKGLLSGNVEKIPVQRKTTLKWNFDGELSAVDMARVIDLLKSPELKECELACNLDD